MVSTQISNPTTLTSFESGVVRTLLYFDIFNYPLTLEEIVKYHPVPIYDIANAQLELHSLVEKKIIFQHGIFYSMQQGSVIAERRLKGNKLAEVKMPVAKKYSKLISCFPFVRGILLSGSLSKNYMDENSDIDYFVITEPGRLWLTRAMLALFKRIFLFNSHKFFCVNYFVDDQSLEIEEKNIYTAFEMATIIPVYGQQICRQFLSGNDWMNQYFPNLKPNHTTFISGENNWLRKMLEKIFSGAIGERLDLFAMDLAKKRWRKNFSSGFSKTEFDIAFKSERNVSKGHPQFFQKRVLNYFDEKINGFEKLYQIKISA